MIDVYPQQPVLIAGPPASGKSALALHIAEAQGGVIVNADALQVFDSWRIVTARPSEADLARAPHLLYGHVGLTKSYSVGDWLRDLDPLLEGQRPIIVGGTGLYLSALTEGPKSPPPPPTSVQRRIAFPLPRSSRRWMMSQHRGLICKTASASSAPGKYYAPPDGPSPAGRMRRRPRVCPAMQPHPLSLTPQKTG